MWAKLYILSSRFVTTEDLTLNWKVHHGLSQLDQVTVLGYFCIYCCLHKIRRSDAFRVFVKSILSLLSFRIFVCLLFTLFFFFAFVFSALHRVQFQEDLSQILELVFTEVR